MNSKYKLKIEGKNTKRFIKDLIKMKILLYYMETNELYSIIIVDDDGYKKTMDIKTSYNITIVDLYGISKYKKAVKKYSVFLICLVFGVVLLEILSNVVFSIEVEHSKSDIRELVLNDLKEFGIEKYHFKVSYKEKEKIIKKILKKETERLEWLEIDSVGTKYIVKVEERVKNNIKKQTATQHIIAKKNAMILEISADSGEVKVKKYDYVQKGDILISGFISKDEEIKKKVRAEGIVFGEVWYNVEISVPKTYREVKYTKNTKKRLEVKFLNKSMFLFDFDKYQTYKIKRVNLLKNNILPIEINYSTIKETNEIVKKYNTKKGEQEALEMAEERLKRKLGVNATIISKNVLKKIEKDSRIVIDVFFKVKEDITDTENIDDIEIEELEGDEDGTND